MLCYQSHTLGLFPRGKTQHARVRDNVYCAATLWCLSMAYRHVGYDRGRTYELEQSAVKCMRGLLFCYMRQAEKVEKFKSTQNWEDALHAKFDYMTGDPVTNDDSWGHLQVRRDGEVVYLESLQIDGTSLFLQILAQMTATGVQVVFTLDEVDFVQNLVYYVERAYRIPDFGMWERGSRDNIGKRELHSSSIGMAKAALEAMNGLNLFGESGSSLSVIHVDPDAQYRNCVILNTLLPKESNSKEVDAALLLITGYPAFAIDDVNLSKTTEQRVKKLLEGQSGFKRFTRDGHYTIKEDKRKTFYDSHEVAQLKESNAKLCRGHRDKAESYWKKLEACTVEMNGVLYYVPEEELVADETGTLVSMATSRDYNYKLVPFSETVPFLWAQAIYLIARMLSECIEGCGEGVIVEGSVLREDNLIDVSDCDPLGLHLPHTARHRGMARHLGFRAPGHDTVIQVALISETTRLQAVLATHGIPTQTQKQVEPIKIRSPADILMKVFSHIGENRKLGLSGRPNRPIGALATSKVYRVFGHTMIFYPTDSMVDFYLSFDGTFLIDVLKATCVSKQKSPTRLYNGCYLLKTNITALSTKATTLISVQPAPNGPTPVQPAPNGPTLVQPAPNGPTLVQPAPNGPTLVQPAPNGPTLVQPAPNGPTLVQPAPNGPTLVQPAPNGPTLVQPAPNVPTLVQPAPNGPTLVQPAPNGPTLVQPAPNGPTLVQPARNGPTLVQPAPNGPTLVQPAPNGPTLVQPAPNGPTLVQPAPNGPTLVQPAPNGPTLVQPAPNGPTLVQPAPNGPTLSQLLVMDHTIQPAPNGPTLVQPAPNRPTLVQPAPNGPTLVQPAPNGPTLVQPAPNGPTLVQPAPNGPTLVQPAPNGPTLIQPAPNGPTLVQPAPNGPTLVQPAPNGPTLVQPAPNGPTLVQPAPNGPTLVQPAPNGPTLVQPAPNGPTLVQPAPNGPTLVQPAPNGPTLIQPAPNGPTLVQPAPNGPTLVQPARNGPTLVQPARNGPTLVQPASNGPTLVQPARNGPTLVQPAPNGPTLVQPAPNRPTLVQPAPNGPTLVQPASNVPTLVQLLVMDPH
eukprot:Em0018g85a